MSAITISGDLVHYEVMGRGKPVILLHSWLGSWRYWIPTMQQLSMKYRTYAIDLWGFGDSGKNKLYYGIDGQVELLQNFIDRMGIPKAVFVGHGLGASVMAHFGTKPESREVVHRMMAIAPPLFGRIFPSNPPNPEIVMPPVPAAPSPLPPATTVPAMPVSSADNAIFGAPLSPRPADTPSAAMPAAPATDIPTIARISKEDRERLLLGQTSEPDSAQPLPASSPSPPPEPEDTGAHAPTIVGVEATPNPLVNIIGKMKPVTLLSRHMDIASADYEKLKTEVEKADEEAIFKSVQSLNRFNTMYHLMQAKAPTLTLMGLDDTFVPVPNEAILSQLTERRDFRVIILPNTRHFPMLEDVTKFTRLLREFFEAPNLDELEMKDEWRRRTR
jgi:pimeloyl-ACP methyl ester carboxylesterase